MGDKRQPDVTGLGGYDLVRRLAVGGMAEVLLARQTVRPGIERMVVIKSILPGLAEHADLVTMFLSEARIAAQLQHPNVIQIHDVTRLGTRPCIVMEHLVGLDTRKLGKRVRERGETLPIGLVAAIGEGAALGLGYAHRAIGVDGQALSVVHRDVSPHNLFVTVDGIVKVLDFGIAKSSEQLQATRDGTLKGKVAYMSPEQLRGEPLDGRSDLFALGAVLWELATGQKLFARPTEIESLAAVAELLIQAPSAVRAGIPVAFDRAVMQALTRDRALRPATGEDLARALHAIAEAECDGPPAMALGQLARSLVEQPDRPSTPVVSPAVPTLPGPGVAPDATIAQGAPTMSLGSEALASAVAAASAPPGAPSMIGMAPAALPVDFAAGDLRLEGIEAPGREEELPTTPRASKPAEVQRPTPAPPPPPEVASAPEVPSGARSSAFPERAAVVEPHVRDRFDPDGEDMGGGERSSPRLELAVDVELERRAKGQRVPDAERRAAAVADFGEPPFFLLTPLYTLRVLRRRATLAARVVELGGRIPILEAEARDAQAAIGRVVREVAKDRRIAGEVAAVDAAAERVAATAEAEPHGRREVRRAEKGRLEAEVGLEERLADLGQAAVSRVAEASATAPLEAVARAAARHLADARTELELCELGREVYDSAAFRTGWILVFLALSTAATLLIASGVSGSP
jgi:serine/threonine-protein kinase